MVWHSYEKDPKRDPNLENCPHVCQLVGSGLFTVLDHGFHRAASINIESDTHGLALLNMYHGSE